MTEPQSMQSPTPKSRIDWDEVRRRQERTDDLIDRLRDAVRRLDKIIERATEKD